MRFVIVPYEALNAKLIDYSQDLEGSSGILQEDLIQSVLDLHYRHRGRYGLRDLDAVAELLVGEAVIRGLIGQADNAKLLCTVTESLELVSDHLDRVLAARPSKEYWAFKSFLKRDLILERLLAEDTRRLFGE